MPYFSAKDSRTGQHLLDFEYPDLQKAQTFAQYTWGNPGDGSGVIVTEHTPADLFLRTIGPAVLNVGLKSEEKALWLGSCEGDYELEGVGDRKDAVFVHDFVVSESGRGLGSRLIRVLTRHADQLGVAIYLNPWATHGPSNLNQYDLEAWYARHGWVWTNPIDHVMLREPKKV